MIVREFDGFRKVKLAFESKPDQGQLLHAIRAAYAFDSSHGSYPLFQNLTRKALKRLRTIENSYVIALSSYHRFNDACGDDNWRAVQIGPYLLNNGTYFPHKPDPTNPYYLDGKLASDVIDQLEAADWRGLFRDINGLDRSEGYYPREFGLLRKDDREFLVLGDSVNGDAYGGIFEIHEAGDFEFVGFPRQWDERGYEAEVDDRLDQGIPIEWADLPVWAETYLSQWDESLLHQERQRLLPATLEMPHSVRIAALAYLAENNPLAAMKTVSDALSPLRGSEAPRWVWALQRGLDVDGSSPTYLREVCKYVRGGNLSDAVSVLMENAGLSEREARNWVESYIDYLALTTPPSGEGGFRDIIRRTFSKWRK